MARYYVDQKSEFPYHITARSPNREPFRLPISEVWKLFESHLSLAHYKKGLKIHSAVLMPNHFHLIASTSEFDIGSVMSEFLGGLSKDMNLYSGRINQNWGTRHYKCVLSSYQYFLNCYKYVYQNPVRSGLSRHCEQWPYSTLHGILGFSRLRVPLEADTILFNPGFDQAELKWLNELPTKENLLAFQKALRKREFKLPSEKKKALHPLESLRL